MDNYCEQIYKESQTLLLFVTVLSTLLIIACAAFLMKWEKCEDLAKEVERLKKVASDAKAEEMRYNTKAAETWAAFGRLLGEELVKMKQQNAAQNEPN